VLPPGLCQLVQVNYACLPVECRSAPHLLQMFLCKKRRPGAKGKAKEELDGAEEALAEGGQPETALDQPCVQAEELVQENMPGQPCTQPQTRLQGDGPDQLLQQVQEQQEARERQGVQSHVQTCDGEQQGEQRRAHPQESGAAGPGNLQPDVRGNAADETAHQLGTLGLSPVEAQGVQAWAARRAGVELAQMLGAVEVPASCRS